MIPRLRQSFIQRPFRPIGLLTLSLLWLAAPWALAEDGGFAPLAIASPTGVQGYINQLKTPYSISPGDTLSVSVYDEPELTQEAIRVAPDGTATIQPLGNLPVSGLAVSEVQHMLERRLSELIRNPRVTVKIKQLHSPVVYVLGAVQRPGAYQQMRDPSTFTGRLDTPLMRSELTLANVIANAGGVQWNADLQHVEITNNQRGIREVVDLWKLLQEGSVAQDIYLRSGDTVRIPALPGNAAPNDEIFMTLARSAFAPESFPVRVIGGVRSPGVVQIQPRSAGVNSAIAAAGGFDLEGANNRVMISRLTEGGNLTRLAVDPRRMDLLLRPNDVVVVDYKKTFQTKRTMDLFARLFSPAVDAARSVNGWADVVDPSRRFGQFEN